MMFKMIAKAISQRGGGLVALLRNRPSRPGAFALFDDDGGPETHPDKPVRTQVSQRRAARHVRIERVADDFDLLDF